MAEGDTPRDFATLKPLGTDPKITSIFEVSAEFLGQLKLWFEQNPLKIAFTQITGFTQSSIPSGSVFPYAGATVPADYLFCDGSAADRIVYAALFAAIGVSYGAGDGASTFNLPDLRGRMPVGKGTHADVDTLADNDGSTLANRSPKHGHNYFVSDAAGNQVPFSRGTLGAGETTRFFGPNASSPIDGPAFVTLNFIIKT